MGTDGMDEIKEVRRERTGGDKILLSVCGDAGKIGRLR